MFALNRFKVGQRLALGFGLMVVLLAACIVVAIQMLSRLDVTTDELDGYNHRASLALKWSSLTTLNAARAVGMAKSGYVEGLVTFLEPQVKATTAEISEVQKELETLITSDEGKAILAAIAEERKKYIAIRNEVFARFKEDDLTGGLRKTEKELIPTVATYIKTIDSLVAYQNKLSQEAMARSDETYRNAKLALWTLFAVCTALAIGAGVVITRSVTQPLAVARAGAEAIADGDLTHTLRPEGSDELAELVGTMDRMQERLRQVVGEIRTGTESINTAAREVSAGSQDLSQRTEEAASNLQKTASTLEQITTTARSSADAAAQANQLANSASDVARRGGEVVEQVVSTMDEINTSSRKIGDIIGTIDGIAFQTNILALNAAVEAARAGEQGRGFAVVAGEVRLLAQRSAEAAKEIKSLINSSVEKVETGSRLVSDAGSTMREIVDSVNRVSDIIGEISAATGEQSSGIAHVNEAITQLDQVTQQNAALVEESAAAAESLSEQASRVQESVSVFRV